MADVTKNQKNLRHSAVPTQNTTLSNSINSKCGRFSSECGRLDSNNRWFIMVGNQTQSVVASTQNMADPAPNVANSILKMIHSTQKWADLPQT